MSAKRSSSEAAGVEKQSDAAADSAAVVEDLLKAQRQWAKAQGEIGLRAQQRYEQAQADYAQRVLAAQLSSQEARRNAHHDLILALQDASGEDAEQRRRDAEQAYAKDVEGDQASVAQALDKAGRGASEALQAACEEAQAESGRAHAQYVKSIQECVARLDAATAPGEVLALVGQSLLWASSCDPRSSRG